jgi:hypothetical protein
MADNHPRIPADLDYTSHWYRAPDPPLQDLACLAIDEGRAILVTPVVSGGVIGGTVESGREFFARTAEELHGSHGLSELFDPAAGPIPALTRWERERERETLGVMIRQRPAAGYCAICTFEMPVMPCQASCQFRWGTREFCNN